MKLGLSKKSFDIIVVTNFLNRLIFKKYKRVIKKNGYLIYETFGEGHEKFGRPKNKDYLLKKDELLKLTKNMSLIFYEEIKVINLKKNLLNIEFYVKMFDEKKIIFNSRRSF